MEFDNVETIKRSVEVGSGVSVLPDETVVNEVKAGLLVAVDFRGGPFTREVGIVHRRGVPRPAAGEFIRLLLENAATPPATPDARRAVPARRRRGR